MPPGHVPDPHGSQAAKARLDGVERRLDSLKLRQQTQVLAYVTDAGALTLSTAGLWVNYPNLVKKIVVGDRRVIRLTGFCIVQQHVSKAAVGLGVLITPGAALPVGLWYQSVDGTTDDFATATGSRIFLPSAPGTYTFQVQVQNFGTTDFHPTGAPASLLIEDIGAAPA